MAVCGIQGQLLEITVVSCNNLKDTEWISRQDPYVCLEYGSTKLRTRTCTDGGKNPSFQEKFVIPLIEGLREINIAVWNSNTLTYDDFIGTGKVQLMKVLSQGFDDSPWSIQGKHGRYSGEVRLIMHYPNAHKPMAGLASSAPHNMGQPPPQASLYAAPPPAAYPPTMASYTNPSSYPSYPPSAYPHQPSAYPHQPSTYPPQPAAYPPQPYPSATYPPQAYPPQGYPPQTYPPAPYPGVYPPRPY